MNWMTVDTRILESTPTGNAYHDVQRAGGNSALCTTPVRVNREHVVLLNPDVTIVQRGGNALIAVREVVICIDTVPIIIRLYASPVSPPVSA
jgi:hypothetical protein